MATMAHRLAALACATLVQGACGRHTLAVPPGVDAMTEPDAGRDVAADAGVDERTPPSERPPTATDSPDAPDRGAPPTCLVDFPCSTGGPDHVCVSDTSYRRTVTHDCTFHCGNVPCSGATCDPDGPVIDCAPGTACVQRPIPSNLDAGPPCLPPEAPDAG
jgi:hypothetical protein